MITTVERKLPDKTVTVTVNTDYFIFAYQVTVNGKQLNLVKFDDCDSIELTEASFDKLLKDLSDHGI